MSHVSDFTQSEDQLIYSLINYDNGTQLSDEQVALGSVLPVDGKVQMTLTAVPGSGYNGNVGVEYTRVDIQEFMDIYFPDGLVLQQGNSLVISDLLPEINTALGTAIPAGSIIDSTIGPWAGTPNEILDLFLTIKPSSRVYQGQAAFKLDGNDIQLSDVVTVRILAGLNMPGSVVAIDYQPLISAMIYPFEANTTQTESEIVTELSRYLGVAASDIQFAPGTVFPSLAAPSVNVTLVSNNPEIVFGGSSQTVVPLGIGRYVIPNVELPAHLTNGAQWTWNAARGWYNDITQPDTGAVSLTDMVGIEALFPRLKHVGGTFTQYPLQATNGLGSNYLSVYQDEVFTRVGTWDQYNGVATQWIYKDNGSANVAGDVVDHIYRMNLAAPGQRAAVTKVMASSAWRSGFNKGIRGMKDIFFDLYVTKAPVKAKHFRLFIEKVQGDVYAEINTLYLRDSEGLNLLTVDRVVAATDSSRYPNQSTSTYGPMNVIEGVGGGADRWTSSGNAMNNSWIAFELNEEIVVESMAIQVETAARSPILFQLQTSDNGVDWKQVKRSNTEVGWTARSTRSFTL